MARSKDEPALEVMAVSVPVAGKALGLGRNKAYEAAMSGDLPTLRFGKRLVVPLAALNRLLESAGKPAKAA